MPAGAHHLYVPPEPPPELPHLTEHSRPSGGEVHPMTAPPDQDEYQQDPPAPQRSHTSPRPGARAWNRGRGQQVAGVGGEVG